jgi:predicted nucleic-acid-binding Zn-ribbon protein
METCPDCKDVAFFPQGGWICDRCKKKCSKLEAQYNHGPDVICKKCHIASHPIQTVTLDTITARLDIILDKYAAYPCHLCDQKKIIINSQLDTVKCEHCGNQWDTIDEYHAERTGPKLSDVVQNKPKAIPYVWCINCGESTPGGGRHSEKTNRNLCQRCYDKENAPAPNMQQIRESLWERLQKILANITPENALEFDAWLDDVEKEFLQAAT